MSFHVSPDYTGVQKSEQETKELARYAFLEEPFWRQTVTMKRLLQGLIGGALLLIVTGGYYNWSSTAARRVFDVAHASSGSDPESVQTRLSDIEGRHQNVATFDLSTDKGYAANRLLISVISVESIQNSQALVVAIGNTNFVKYHGFVLTVITRSGQMLTFQSQGDLNPGRWNQFRFILGNGPRSEYTKLAFQVETNHILFFNE